jgi:hypothetical protein
VHIRENIEIVRKNIFHLEVNIVGSVDNFFLIFCNLSKLQFIDASCHCALCCVIIMNLMVHMYFMRRVRKISKLHGQKVVSL